jgi:hypothetical protein
MCLYFDDTAERRTNAWWLNLAAAEPAKFFSFSWIRRLIRPIHGPWHTKRIQTIFFQSKKVKIPRVTAASHEGGDF